jgi:hypothetical protein
MTLIPRFRSDADVERYFVLLGELTPRMEPPPDLWELIESSRLAVQQKVPMSRCLAPAPQSVELQVFTSAKRRNVQPATPKPPG